MKIVTLLLLNVCFGLTFTNNELPAIKFTCWKLLSIQTEKDKTAKALPPEINCNLFMNDRGCYGYSGCNQFITPCTVKGDTVVFARPQTDYGHCPTLQWIEGTLYEKLMHGSAAYRVSGDTLTFTGKQHTVFTFLKTTECRGLGNNDLDQGK